MNRRLRILLIEDNQDDAELILAHIREAGWEVEATVIGSEEELRRRLALGWDLVVSDYMLPQFGAPEALVIVGQVGVDLPFIVVSGCIGEEAAVEIMRQGAADCINKDNLARLAPAIERELKEAENRRARRAAEEELARLAFHDDLTDLPNRRRFIEVLNDQVRSGASFAVLVFTFGRIRMIADTLGQAEGDRLIQGVALRLRGLLPADVLLGRSGCDEFAAVMAVEGRDDWAPRLERLLRGFGTPFLVRERELFVAPTVGVSLCPADGVEAEGLLRNAKAAMLRAHSAEEPYRFFTPELERENLQRLLICQRLRETLRRNELELHYQPKVSLTDGRVCGLEALLRWNDAELGPVPPALFIPVAEESGEIVAIGEWVLREVCRQQRRWREAGLPPIKVAVNIAARQLRDTAFVERVRAILAEERLPPSALELEVTESDIMADADRAAGILSEVMEMGVTIAVDDFGTGYSSLSYLKKLPISTLKVDRSFISDVVEDGDSRAIVEAIVALAHGLGLEVVAEGVERQEHVEFLSRLGCQQAQGYLFSRPLNVAQCETYLRLNRDVSARGRLQLEVDMEPAA